MDIGWETLEVNVGHHDPPTDGQAVFFLTGLIEVLPYISEL